MGLLLLRIWAYFLSSRHGSVEACLIHNLKVAGSNPEVGNIFSERYLARKGVEKRERKRIGRNCEGDLGLERVGKIIFFLVT